MHKKLGRKFYKSTDPTDASSKEPLSSLALFLCGMAPKAKDLFLKRTLVSLVLLKGFFFCFNMLGLAKRPFRVCLFFFLI